LHGAPRVRRRAALTPRRRRREVRSLNGARVAALLRQRLVPDFGAYRETLRAARAWAQQRGLYSNSLGLLGGINLALLVAFVAQRFPRAAPAALLVRFFRVMDLWEWPHPIMLAPIVDAPAAARDGDGEGGAFLLVGEGTALLLGRDPAGPPGRMGPAPGPRVAYGRSALRDLTGAVAGPAQARRARRPGTRRPSRPGTRGSTPATAARGCRSSRPRSPR
jgi:hypothetical protein